MARSKSVFVKTEPEEQESSSSRVRQKPAGHDAQGPQMTLRSVLKRPAAHVEQVYKKAMIEQKRKRSEEGATGKNRKKKKKKKNKTKAQVKQKALVKEEALLQDDPGLGPILHLQHLKVWRKKKWVNHLYEDDPKSIASRGELLEATIQRLKAHGTVKPYDGRQKCLRRYLPEPKPWGWDIAVEMMFLHNGKKCRSQGVSTDPQCIPSVSVEDHDDGNVFYCCGLYFHGRPSFDLHHHAKHGNKKPGVRFPCASEEEKRQILIGRKHRRDEQRKKVSQKEGTKKEDEVDMPTWRTLKAAEFEDDDEDADTPNSYSLDTEVASRNHEALTSELGHTPTASDDGSDEANPNLPVEAKMEDGMPKRRKEGKLKDGMPEQSEAGKMKDGTPEQTHHKQTKQHNKTRQIQSKTKHHMQPINHSNTHKL